ncbi:hypothetical protein BGZ83_010768 [Gryganskiella cystojenkinii]|nr:hypothetical protein BGZ83_010768 [Gryganskiella cystojenkinii]
MDDYQTIEQRGIQELVAVRHDEEGLPCVFLRDIDAIFPNTSTISSYGVRVHFATNASGTPKLPLRIPFFENRVLEIFSDNSVLEWSREATATRLAAAAASATASITPVNTVHTRQLPGILDLPADFMIPDDSDHQEDQGSDISFDMAESAESSEEDEDGDTFDVHSPPRSNTLSPPPPPPSETRTLATVQSFERLRLGPLPQENRSEEPPSPALAPSSSSIRSSTSSYSASHHQQAIPEEADDDGDDVLPPPPTYEPIDTGVIQAQRTGVGSIVEVPYVAPIIDDPAERHLVFDRVGLIKRITNTILSQKYDAESCPHPPLFIVLPETPSRWSFGNVLHNKMRLHFLCDCCEHEVFTYDPQETRGTASKRNIHVDQSKGFELCLDQYPDQLLLIKFGQYILNLLRMLQYGVSLEGTFVAAAFDRPVPIISKSGTSVGGKSGIDPQLFFKLKQNVERSIAFMEALLGDDYEEDEITEAIKKLDLNDFRLLDAIVKRPSYTLSATSSSSATTPSTLEESAHDIHRGGSGLYCVTLNNGKVRWSCEKYYNLQFQNLDKVFGSKLQFLQMSFDTHTRSSNFQASSENQLNSRIIAVSKIKSLFKIDFTIDWNFTKQNLTMLLDLIRRDATTVSTLSIRFSKNVAPLHWHKSSNTGPSEDDEQQPISAILNLVKNRKIKHLSLEGDVDITSVPNLGAMDFSNLDILSIMKTNNRGYFFMNNNANKTSDAGSGRDSDEVNVPHLQHAQAKTLTADTYIPLLVSVLPAFTFLTEAALGFPDMIPGHIRILQACMTGLSRLQRLDLFRIAGVSSSVSGGLNRKLELSANIASSKLVRLYLSECRVIGEAKARLLESLEELLTDEGPDLEDLEFRFIGFNDRHAHALEFGTRPVGSKHCCRLRRLVIHGKGLEHAGVSAMKRVLRRATRPSLDNLLGSTEGETSVATAAPASAIDPNTLSFGVLLEEPTLTHLELCSIDSVSDADWSSLLSDLQLTKLITLDLQGVWFGDRAIASLAKATVDSAASIASLGSPMHSPTSDTFPSSALSSSFPSSPSPPPPAFFSASAPLHLQTLRLSCASLSKKGIGHLQELLSRLIHLSKISLHGFRRVTSEDWMDILARVSFRWIEVVEIVSSGYDDACAQYLGDRILAREQMLEQTTTVTEDNEPALPGYSARPVTTAAASSSSSTSTTTAIVSGSSSSSSTSSPAQLSTSPSTGRSSFSNLIRTGTIRRNSREDQNGKRPENKSLTSPTPAVVPPSKPAPFQKYLEIDLRYTDVSAKGLSILRNRMTGQAKKVVIRMRDGEEEFDIEEEASQSSSSSASPRTSALTKKLEAEKSANASAAVSGRRSSGSGLTSTSSLTVSSFVGSAGAGSSTLSLSSSSNGGSSSATAASSLSSPSATVTPSQHGAMRRLKSAFIKK